LRKSKLPSRRLREPSILSRFVNKKKKQLFLELREMLKQPV
jgi:hypothetical protein